MPPPGELGRLPHAELDQRPGQSDPQTATEPVPFGIECRFVHAQLLCQQGQTRPADLGQCRGRADPEAVLVRGFDRLNQLWNGRFVTELTQIPSRGGTFLWATPAISAELERRSWVYLAVRPNGGTAVLLGKYLAAVSWVLTAALVGLAIALAISPTARNVGVGRLSGKQSRRR